jgi:hypothetical protein
MRIYIKKKELWKGCVSIRRTKRDEALADKGEPMELIFLGELMTIPYDEIFLRGTPDITVGSKYKEADQTDYLIDYKWKSDKDRKKEPPEPVKPKQLTLL